MSWTPGRQGSGYEKMLLAVAPFPVPWDLYLLRYPVGSYIPIHKDPVEKGRHYRLNIILRHAGGGEFLCDPDWVVFRLGRVVLFRPDRAEHAVTGITRGTRYVLSFGFVLPG